MIDYQLKKTPKYLYLIKLAVFLASELCSVAVRGRTTIRKGRVRFRISSGYDFLFSLFLFFLVFFFLQQHQPFRRKTLQVVEIFNFFFLLVNVVSHL